MLTIRDLKITLRMLFNDKLFSLINVSGLSIGFAISLLIFMYVKYENSYEQYNPLSQRVARLTMDYYDGKTLVDQDAETYAPLAPLVHSEFPEVLIMQQHIGWMTPRSRLKANFIVLTELLRQRHLFYESCIIHS